MHDLLQANITQLEVILKLYFESFWPCSVVYKREKLDLVAVWKQFNQILSRILQEMIQWRRYRQLCAASLGLWQAM